jgi:hypothetical protein
VKSEEHVSLPTDLPVAEAITENEADDAEEPEEFATIEEN